MGMIKALKSEQWGNVGFAASMYKGKTRQEGVKVILHQQANEGVTSLVGLCRSRIFGAQTIDHHDQAKLLMPINGK
jgi:hypothetical protein